MSQGKRVAYRHEALEYDGDKVGTPLTKAYQTDLLIHETRGGNLWLPRVVIECKLGNVTTHDALVYGAKAASHRHVQPYLRYGILVGKFDRIPPRLMQHGAQFDFIAVWNGDQPTAQELESFVRVVRDEVEASRNIESLLRDEQKCRLFHRRLSVCP